MNDTQSLLINPKTIARMQLLVKKPPHALLVSGQSGAGKLHTTRLLLRQINPLMDIQVFENIDGKSLGIDMIRELRNLFKSKSTSEIPERAAIINPADALTDEAQNALLKTLEEPPAGVMIVLISSGVTSLKPTILSRVQKLPVLPVSLDDSLAHFSEYDQAEVRKAYIISGGAAELLQKMLTNNDTATLESLDMAKQFLTATRFNRLKQIEQYKNSATELVEGLERLISATLQNPNLSDSNRDRYINLYKSVKKAKTDLNTHVNKKTLLLELALRV